MIKYNKKNKRYHLEETVSIQTDLRPGEVRAIKDYVMLLPSGLLVVYKGYFWDGATMAPDFTSVIRASLVHDALYQMIEEGLLPLAARPIADKLLKSVMIEDGAYKIVAEIFYRAVKHFGGLFAK